LTHAHAAGEAFYGSGITLNAALSKARAQDVQMFSSLPTPGEANVN